VPKYSLNLGFFYADVPLIERIAQARKDGFTAVEFWWPAGVDHQQIVAAVREAGVSVELFNMDEGDYARGERGYAGDPSRREEWRASLQEALALAEALRCPRINALTGDAREDLSREEQLESVVENLSWAAPIAAGQGVSLLLEPLNAATHPTYLCRTTREAQDLMDRIDAPNIQLQYDVYQAQRGEGDIVETLRSHLDRIGHIQIADSPSRAAPGTGELNFAFILKAIDDMGYNGYIGLEYKPEGDALGWLPFDERG